MFIGALVLAGCGSTSKDPTAGFKASGAQHQVPTAAPTATPTHDADYIARVFDRTNMYHEQNGCASYHTDPRLVAAAYGHSHDMAINNYFAHAGADGSNPGQRIKAAGYPASNWAENIAIWPLSPEQLVDSFYFETPPNDGHRKNIQNCALLDLGIGYFYFPDNPQNGYWTEDFGTL